MIRVFINAVGVDVPPGSTALDAVRVWNATAADEITGGRRIITDSRGLELPETAPMSAGSILRLVAKRERGASEVSSATE
jgi:hypothetical protein